MDIASYAQNKHHSLLNQMETMYIRVKDVLLNLIVLIDKGMMQTLTLVFHVAITKEY
jgi:hypothetical protein